MYGHAVRFVTAWASDATVDMLAADYEGARAALQEYLLHGLGLAEQPMWVRPRYETETAWIELVRTMRAAVEAGPAGSSWYEPAVAIGALADVYRVANSLRHAALPMKRPPQHSQSLLRQPSSHLSSRTRDASHSSTGGYRSPTIHTPRSLRSSCDSGLGGWCPQNVGRRGIPGGSRTHRRRPRGHTGKLGARHG